MSDYDTIARQCRAPLAPDADTAELVRYATLAANAHNTQPWRFHGDARRIVIRPDLDRRTPVVDPDDHHLFVSLGCAAENLALAAAATGRRADVGFDPADGGAVVVDLAPGPRHEDDLFAAIPHRQCTRSLYDGRAVPPDALRRLEGAAAVPGVALLLVTDHRRREDVLACIVEANRRQMADAAFLRELTGWVRFSKRAAAATRDGLYSGVLGSPPLPSWLGRAILPLVLRPGPETDKVARQVWSSAGLAVFVADTAGPEAWVAVGRSYQRFALQATALGLRHAFLNQPVEVASVRPQLADRLGIDGRRPDLVVRFGSGAAMPRSLRRPVEQVLT